MHTFKVYKTNILNILNILYHMLHSKCEGFQKIHTFKECERLENV